MFSKSYGWLDSNPGSLLTGSDHSVKCATTIAQLRKLLEHEHIPSVQMLFSLVDHIVNFMSNALIKYFSNSLTFSASNIYFNQF